MDLVFVLLLFFHAGYGLCSIAADYIKPGLILRSFAFLVIILMAILALLGISLIVAL